MFVSDEFARSIMRETAALSKRWHLDEERTAIAVVIAWDHARRSRNYHDPCVFAFFGCRRARCGNDLGGIKAHSKRDVLNRCRVTYGADMANVPVRSPGPAELAEASELWAQRWPLLTPRHKRVVRWTLARRSTRWIAERLQCSQALVSRLRREACELLK